jgi:hypothetical protein
MVIVLTMVMIFDCGAHVRVFMLRS